MYSVPQSSGSFKQMPICFSIRSDNETPASKLEDQRCLRRVRCCNKECVPNADFMLAPVAGRSHLGPVKGEQAAS